MMDQFVNKFVNKCFRCYTW